MNIASLTTNLDTLPPIERAALWWLRLRFKTAPDSSRLRPRPPREKHDQPRHWKMQPPRYIAELATLIESSKFQAEGAEKEAQATPTPESQPSPYEFFVEIFDEEGNQGKSDLVRNLFDTGFLAAVCEARSYGNGCIIVVSPAQEAPALGAIVHGDDLLGVPYSELNAYFQELESSASAQLTALQFRSALLDILGLWDAHRGAEA